MLGALVAGIGWIGMYGGISYFLGEEIARAVGTASIRVIIGVLAIVAIGLAVRAGYTRWRAEEAWEVRSAGSLPRRLGQAPVSNVRKVQACGALLGAFSFAAILAAGSLAAGCGSSAKSAIASLSPSRSVSFSPGQSASLSASPSAATPAARPSRSAAAPPVIAHPSSSPAPAGEPGSGLI